MSTEQKLRTAHKMQHHSRTCAIYKADESEMNWPYPCDCGYQAERDATPAAPSQETALTGCNCRWDGDKQAEWCELHLAHKDAIHEWAERAKNAEAKLAQMQPSQPVTLTDGRALKDAFEEGYCSRSTYNDVDISDVETEWAKSSAKASIAALREKEGK